MTGRELPSHLTTCRIQSISRYGACSKYDSSEIVVLDLLYQKHISLKESLCGCANISGAFEVLEFSSTVLSGAISYNESPPYVRPNLTSSINCKLDEY